MKLFRYGAVVLLGVVILMSGCSSTPDVAEENAKQPNRFASIDGDYRIGVDDRLQITVWRNPELSITVPVRPDGKISVPLIGDVQAGGNTPAQVAVIIKEKLAAWIVQTWDGGLRPLPAKNPGPVKQDRATRCRLDSGDRATREVVYPSGTNGIKDLFLFLTIYGK